MDDETGPIGSPVVGAPATVIPRGEAAGGLGTLLADRLFAVILAVPHAPWQPGDDVIISVGEQGQTVAALARFREARPGQAIFTRQSPWRPFDRRTFERYPVSIAANVADPPHRYPATVVDVSLGGCAIETGTAPPEDAAALALEWSGLPAPLTVTLVRARPTGPDRFTWHLRFRLLTPAAATFLGELIAALAAELEAPAT